MKNFLTSESGAVTIDWVILTVGLVGLGLAVSAAVGPAVLRSTNVIGQTLCQAGAGTYTDVTGASNTGYTGGGCVD